MKILSWITATFALLVGAAYVLLFTGFGNNTLKPIIEEKISQELNASVVLNKFLLSSSEMDIELELTKENIIKIYGGYSLFSQGFDLKYDASLNKLEQLKGLTKSQLNGSFKTNGTIKGNKRLLQILGTSDLASSDTSYDVILKEFETKSIMAKIQNAKVDSLLYMTNQAKYANGLLDLDVNFKNITPHFLDGNILLNSKNAKLNTKLMQQDFNITIPATSFSMNLDAKLLKDDVIFKYNFLSNLAKINANGTVSPENFKTDLLYDIKIKELALLEPILKAALRGPFDTDGTVKGDKKDLNINGKTNIAKSKTTYNLKLQNLAPKTAKLSINSLQIDKLLYMLNQKNYSNGLLLVDATINNFKEGSLKGTIDTSITKATMNSKVLTKELKFERAMPKTSYTNKTHTTLDGKKIISTLKFKSNLSNLDMSNIIYDTSTATLTSDYALDVQKLNNLLFITGTKVKGGLKANGKIKSTKDLDISMKSKFAGGLIDASLHNDDIKADIKDFKTLELSYLLSYPEMFYSNLNGVFTYNLLKSKGLLKAKLTNGKFTKNESFDLLKKYTKVDLYKEKFVGNITTNINKNIMKAKVDLQSNKAKISSKDTVIDTLKQTISSNILLEARNYDLTATLSGKTSAPKVSFSSNAAKKKLDAEVKKAKDKLAKKLKEKLDEQISPEIQKEAEEKIKNLFKGFF